MDNLLSEGRKRTQKDPSTSNESSTTAKAQKVSDGFQRFKVNVANMLTLRNVITLATCLGLAPGVVDKLKRSETPTLDVISELESNGFISCSDISRLLDGLKRCNLSGIASKIEYSYQTNVKDHLSSQSRTFQENKDLFINRLQRIYKSLYDAVQPLPYVKDKMCCVDKLFIQGNIQRRSIDGRGKATWKPFGSYHDILAQSINGPTRCIILGDPGYGKSTLSLQFLHDWCNEVEESPLLKVDIVIFLRMRQLGGMTSIYRAIKELLLPSDSAITSADIESIIQNTKSTLILFDGYDEYPDRSNDNTDFIKILKMRKLIDTHVILTTRSANVAETPSELKLQSIQFKLTGFTEADQDKYIMKAVVNGDTEAARFIRDKLSENPVLDDMCQIPLFFTIVAHATHDEENITPNTKNVTWFFRFMQECFIKHTSNKQNSIDITSETARPELSKIAFEGLSNKSQQIVWNKQAVVKAVGESQYNNLIRTGILTEDEHIHVSDRVDTKDFFQQLTTTSFYHKLFCESYAAFYLVDIIRSMFGTGSSSSASDVGSTSVWSDSTDLLSSLDRKDLQYLFRFACGLDKRAGRVIINYLVKETDDTNLAILCLFEFTGEDKDITDAVKILFSRFAKIHGEDSKILQRAKVGVLEIASRCKIPIPDLQLRKSFSYVDGSDIMLRSGLKLPSLSSIEKISINTKSATEEDVIGLLNYGLQSQRFRTIWFFFCDLPEFFNRCRIPTLARTRDVKVLRPNRATQLGLESGQWSEICEIEDIRELCSDTVVIDNTTSQSIQRSVINLLEKASINDIPIFRVSLSQSFRFVDGEDIMLHCGLLLPTLPSLQGMLILTKEGTELKGNDANGILSHLKCSQRLKEVGFYYCLLPMVLFGSFLQTMRDQKVKVFWSPYGFGKRSYTLDLQEGHWLLGEDHASLFPRKSTGDKLTVDDYSKEVETFRNEWRNTSSVAAM